VLKQSFQRSDLKGLKVPEKVGGLLAALYFILVCNILKQMRKTKNTKTVSVKGLLLDKVIGTIHCKLTIKLMILHL